MAEFPALPLWTDAYLSDTRHLSRSEHGAYLLLIMEAWRRPTCSLPDNDDLLARLAAASPEEWVNLKPVIMAFWTLDKKRREWRQKRLTKEHDYVAQKSANQRVKSLKRWKQPTMSHSAAMPEGMPERCPDDAPTPTPTPTPTEVRKKDIPSPADSGVPPPVASLEADVYRRARDLIPKRVGLITEATQAGMTFVEIASVMDRYESGHIGDLATYLRGCVRRSRAGPTQPRKSHLMTVLDTMIERVRDDDRGSVEVREDGHGGIPTPGTARR